ncbi:dihydrodipicolinate synthase family protein [Candidatus Pelagibacter sp.]|nr:dihydrodipicolinate synthase family protein [Candidatus Pelagibacter sp.]
MLSNIKKKINGPIFSIILPFLENEKIDYISLKKYINFLYRRGAKIFYLMVYNSRFSLLDEKEIIKLNLFCIKVIKKLNRNNIVICAEPYHCSTKKSIFLANLFHKKGADIISLIFGEKYYSDHQVYKHFKSIHDNTKGYLLLHQQVLENGINAKKPFCFYSINLLNKICTLSKFIAMKEDSKSNKLTRDICKKLKKKIIIITSGIGKRQWLKASKYGCQSWLSGISNLDPKIAIDFYFNFKKKNKHFIKNYFKYLEDPFFKLTNKYGWHLTIKSFLQIFGHFDRFERMPLLELNNTRFKIIKKISKKIYMNSKKLDKEGYFK